MRVHGRRIQPDLPARPGARWAALAASPDERLTSRTARCRQTASVRIDGRAVTGSVDLGRAGGIAAGEPAARGPAAVTPHPRRTRRRPARPVGASGPTGCTRSWSRRSPPRACRRRGSTRPAAAELAQGRAVGRGGDRHRVGQVAVLPRAGPERGPRAPRPAASGPFATDRPTTLYLAPTKALAADQLRALTALGIGEVRPATYDGDTPVESRDWVRQHSKYVLTNPDMLHRSILPGHPRWAGFLRGLHYVVVDECHRYRGVFGSHVAAVLRRLRRVCAHYGGAPTFVLASATVSDPATSASRLTGLPVTRRRRRRRPAGRDAVRPVGAAADRADRRARGAGAPHRDRGGRRADGRPGQSTAPGPWRSCAPAAAAETVSLATRRLLDEVDPALAARVAAYRAGYLPEERRALEADLQSGRILGVASTNALELGVDIAGLDAVLLAGYPGTRASLWQQAGRAGRAGQGALAVLVARDDPLDTYLVHHPETLFGRPVEATVLDPDNPYVLRPAPVRGRGRAAAHRRRPRDVRAERGRRCVDHLVETGLLRRRATGLFWTRRSGPATWPTSGAPAAQPVGAGRGRDRPAARHSSTRARRTRRPMPGAVYLHQGATYLVDSLDLDDHVALLHPADPDWTTYARDVTDIRCSTTEQTRAWDASTLSFGTVEVSSQVVAFLRKRDRDRRGPRRGAARPARCAGCAPGRCGGRSTEDGLRRAGLAPADVPGAAHAAEHASIGLLPLFATCDRWDIGGVSTAQHPDTGRDDRLRLRRPPRRRRFRRARPRRRRVAWLTATREAIAVLRVRRRAARRACSRRSAATATSRSTRLAPCDCSTSS